MELVDTVRKELTDDCFIIKTCFVFRSLKILFLNSDVRTDFLKLLYDGFSEFRLKIRWFKFSFFHFLVYHSVSEATSFTKYS